MYLRWSKWCDHDNHIHAWRVKKRWVVANRVMWWDVMRCDNRCRCSIENPLCLIINDHSSTEQSWESQELLPIEKSVEPHWINIDLIQEHRKRRQQGTKTKKSKTGTVKIVLWLCEIMKVSWRIETEHNQRSTPTHIHHLKSMNATNNYLSSPASTPPSKQ